MGVYEVYIPPHGVGDTHGSAEERREAEKRDEDGGHLADAVGLPRGLAVHHHAALWAEHKRAGVKAQAASVVILLILQ